MPLAAQLLDSLVSHLLSAADAARASAGAQQQLAADGPKRSRTSQAHKAGASAIVARGSRAELLLLLSELVPLVVQRAVAALGLLAADAGGHNECVAMAASEAPSPEACRVTQGVLSHLLASLTTSAPPEVAGRLRELLPLPASPGGMPAVAAVTALQAALCSDLTASEELEQLVSAAAQMSVHARASACARLQQALATRPAELLAREEPHGALPQVAAAARRLVPLSAQLGDARLAGLSGTLLSEAPRGDAQQGWDAPMALNAAPADAAAIRPPPSSPLPFPASVGPVGHVLPDVLQRLDDCLTNEATHVVEAAIKALKALVATEQVRREHAGVSIRMHAYAWWEGAL